MPIIPFKDKSAAVSDSAFVAPDAWVTGDVNLGDEAVVLFGVSIRGDINPIKVGARTNIQDHSMLHTTRDISDCIVGDEVTIGHHAIIHGCTIHDRCIIGMGSTILDGAVIEENCIIGANSLVPMNKRIPAGSLAFGSPVKVVRKLTPEEIENIVTSAADYVAIGKQYKKQFSD